MPCTKQGSRSTTPVRVTLSSPLPSDLARFLQHLARQEPGEVCGFVFDDPWRIVQITNIAKGDREFEMHHAQTAQYFVEAIGVWHSHPDGHNYPSSLDIMYAPPDKRYWIVTHTAVTEWVLNDFTKKPGSAYLAHQIPDLAEGQGSTADCGVGAGS